MERQAESPTAVPNLVLRYVPQLFASSTPGTQLEMITKSPEQTAATSNCRAAAAAAAAVLGLKGPWISYDG